MTAPSNTNQADAAVYGAGKTTPAAPRKPVSLPRLADMRARDEKITMLTAYDATFAAVADAAEDRHISAELPYGRGLIGALAAGNDHQVGAAHRLPRARQARRAHH